MVKFYVRCSKNIEIDANSANEAKSIMMSSEFSDRCGMYDDGALFYKTDDGDCIVIAGFMITNQNSHFEDEKSNIINDEKKIIEEPCNDSFYVIDEINDTKIPFDPITNSLKLNINTETNKITFS